MSGQHRKQGWFTRLTGRYFTHRLGGDVWPPEAAPVVLDHSHRLGDDRACRDTRCGYRDDHEYGTERVVPVPTGEPDWMPGERGLS